MGGGDRGNLPYIRWVSPYSLSLLRLAEAAHALSASLVSKIFRCTRKEGVNQTKAVIISCSGFLKLYKYKNVETREGTLFSCQHSTVSEWRTFCYFFLIISTVCQKSLNMEVSDRGFRKWPPIFSLANDADGRWTVAFLFLVINYFVYYHHFGPFGDISSTRAPHTHTHKHTRVGPILWETLATSQIVSGS